VAERARWSFVLKVLQQKTMLVSLLRCSPHTTKLYDRTGDQITLDEVEKIQI
jgi:hypothetical protein